MEIGVRGIHGHIALSHALMELAQDHVIVTRLFQLTEGLTVSVTQTMLGFAILRHTAPVNQTFLSLLIQ